MLRIIPSCCPFLPTNELNLQFINETVRLANIVPGIFRKALREIQFKGIYMCMFVYSQFLAMVDLVSFK